MSKSTKRASEEPESNSAAGGDDNPDQKGAFSNNQPGDLNLLSLQDSAVSVPESHMDKSEGSIGGSMSTSSASASSPHDLFIKDVIEELDKSKSGINKEQSEDAMVQGFIAGLSQNIAGMSSTTQMLLSNPDSWSSAQRIKEAEIDEKITTLTLGAVTYDGMSASIENIDIVSQLAENRMKVAAIVLQQRAIEIGALLGKLTPQQTVVVELYARQIYDDLSSVLYTRDPYLQQQLISRIALSVERFNNLVDQAQGQQVNAAFNDFEKKATAYICVSKRAMTFRKVSRKQTGNLQETNNLKKTARKFHDSESYTAGSKASLSLLSLFKRVQNRNDNNQVEPNLMSADAYLDQLATCHKELVFSRAMQAHGLPNLEDRPKHPWFWSMPDRAKPASKVISPAISSSETRTQTNYTTSVRAVLKSAPRYVS